MIVTRSDLQPFTPTAPDQAHHNERLLEYGINLHVHIESLIEKSETPEKTAAELAEALEQRKIEGQRIKDEWMRRFYGTKNVSANALLRRISATTLR